MCIEGRARQSELLSRARPCELLGRARLSDLLAGARPCVLREELVRVNC